MLVGGKQKWAHTNMINGAPTIAATGLMTGPAKGSAAARIEKKAPRSALLALGAGARGTRGGDPPDPSVLRRFLTHLELFFGVIALSYALF